MFLHTRKSIGKFTENWKLSAFQGFEAVMTSTTHPFPCTLGIAGFNADQLRYAFVDEAPSSDQAAYLLAATLQSFVTTARAYGKNTSLVVFFNETRDVGVDNFQSVFWNLINKTHALDAAVWPKQLSVDPDGKTWEFSFAGEPIFVVCNTPSNQARMSRYGQYFAMTFQPRWVFDGITGPLAPNGKKIKQEIRKRLQSFDAVAPSPFLGVYGEVENREWKQYFLEETNQPTVSKCPFVHRSNSAKVEVQKTMMTDLSEVIAALLPPTGAVEVQVDTPHRIHSRHQHAADETLHIVRGEISFGLDNTVVKCQAGDRLWLPAGTSHESFAGSTGCLYVIATRFVFAAKSVLVSEEVQYG